ncbi:MAG: exodeoxyribonuclease VII small subunit [Methanobrevibacter sp.]|uniref:exodeoxyribonuclease VII small subunit n=1 Tax=Methanobrevibacter sp. TaxID=66852 RepID=UPI0025F755D5|nr:exodeoxyribonuclease VII small subunit [Methanobrevibacter sp.]MBQ2612541.1 exodeoxyribonuclease VII small subunit [Methanobrevibacter sp.]MEE0025554.1 exodeoxyribonuclease VII small subunit [Methanobrevibacter sp.]
MVDENASFEDNLKELEEIVEKLEKGDVPLDNAIEEFKKAMDLVKACDNRLKDAQDTIAKIVNENGEVVDFNVE